MAKRQRFDDVPEFIWVYEVSPYKPYAIEQNTDISPPAAPPTFSHKVKVHQAMLVRQQGKLINLKYISVQVC